MDDPQKKTLIERYIAAYNAFDVSGMVATMTDDVVFLNVSDGEITMMVEGREELREAAEQAKEVFSWRRQTPTAWTFEGDTVKVEIEFVGVLAVDVEDGPHAGEEMMLRGWSVFKFEGGLIRVLEDHS